MPRMEYVEHAPPLDLHRHVQCLWILRDDAPDDAIQAIYPDGGDALRLAAAFVRGRHLTP